MQYYQTNQQALQQEQNTLEKKASEWGNTAEILYPQPGTTMVRILPPYSESGVFFHKIVKHNLKLGGQKEIFICPEATANLSCPICLKGQELTNSRDEQKMKFARENLRPRERYLYNVLCYSGPPNANGEALEFGKVYVLEVGIMIHRKIIALDQDPQTGWADITNPENGVILMIKRTGKGQFDTIYEVNPHGGGRTNLFADCQTRGVDWNSLQLTNLEQVYTLPPDWKLEELASSIDKIVGGGFSSTPTPRPALPTVSPTAAAAASVAPVESAPVPGAALPQVPQWPQAPVSTPSQPGVPPPPVAPPVAPPRAPQVPQGPQRFISPPPQPGVPPGPISAPVAPFGAPQVPQVPPPPGYMAPQTGYVAPDTTSSSPKVPSIPAPPNDDEEIPF